MVRWALGCVALAGAGSAAASPPAPPPEVSFRIAEAVVPDQSRANFAAYAAIFADDLVVTINGQVVANSKVAWLAIEQARLGKVDRRELNHVLGQDAVLVLDRFDDRSDVPDNPRVIADARYKIRALRYGFGPDRLVHSLQILQTDGLLGFPALPPPPTH